MTSYNLGLAANALISLYLADNEKISFKNYPDRP